MKIAFLSFSRTDGFVIDDELAAPYLSKQGVLVETVPWDVKTDWDKFEAVIVRSTWDYQKHSEEFFGVLKDISNKTRLLNPLEVILKNSHKSYLFEMAERVPVIPSLKGSEFDDAIGFMEHFQTDRVIFKPFIGANADQTYPVKRGESVGETVFNDSFFVQPFLPAVVSEGEFSLFYFLGKFSHAVLKTPKPGDYRVQEDHGGHVRKILPESELLNAGDRIIKNLDNLLYARVDLVRHAGEFMLMELELIEPALYLRCDDKAPLNFAQAIVATLRDGRAERI